MKSTTLCFAIVDGKVLLAMKKRGMGVGKWNGPGGKLESGETEEQACRREVLEEVGVELGALEHRGWIEFVYRAKPEWDNRCAIFVARGVIGELVESEEMLPRWFEIGSIPLDEMWEDDRIWLPGILLGESVKRRFVFDGEGKLIR